MTIPSKDEKRSTLTVSPKDVMGMFRGKFRAFMALWVVTMSYAYLFAVTFIPKAAEMKHTGTIIGFITGTSVAMILAFYFSGSTQVDERELQDKVLRLEKELEKKNLPETIGG